MTPYQKKAIKNVEKMSRIRLELFYSSRTVKQRYHDYFHAFVSVEKTKTVIVILIEDETMRRIMGDAPVSN